MPEPSGNPHEGARIPVDVLIAGAGFSGICRGIQLLEAGIKDFLIIDKSDDLSGMWYGNRYPSRACHVPRLVRDGLAVLDLPELRTSPVAAAAAAFAARGWSWRYASVHRPKRV
jgi:cation diffusion facilitator CzcD-associated flavoprotein CzcO